MAGRRVFVRGRLWVSSRGISSFRQSVQLEKLSFSDKDVLFMDNHVSGTLRSAGIGDEKYNADNDVPVLTRIECRRVGSLLRLVFCVLGNHRSLLKT